MPLYEFQCLYCNYVFEAITHIDEKCMCPECMSKTKRLISASGVNVFNNDAGWIKDVIEVVDKEGGIACQRLIKDPSRENYKAWMKDEGVRHLEDGESRKPVPVDLTRVNKEVMEKHMARNRLEVRT